MAPEKDSKTERNLSPVMRSKVTCQGFATGKTSKPWPDQITWIHWNRLARQLRPSQGELPIIGNLLSHLAALHLCDLHSHLAWGACSQCPKITATSMGLFDGLWTKTHRNQPSSSRFEDTVSGYGLRSWFSKTLCQPCAGGWDKSGALEHQISVGVHVAWSAFLLLPKPSLSQSWLAHSTKM